MTLPLILSVPHSGNWIPSEVEDICLLSPEDIIKDQDRGAKEIFLPLKQHVKSLVAAQVARVIIDVDRAKDDFSEDGVIKTITRWSEPVFRLLPSEEIIEELLSKYYFPYHAALANNTKHAKLGIDCHTAVPIGLSSGPDPGRERPLICLSNANQTCPWPWLYSLAYVLGQKFKCEVSINKPFSGGHIIRSNSKDIPWIQLTFSQTSDPSVKEKKDRLLSALKDWCKYNFG